MLRHARRLAAIALLALSTSACRAYDRDALARWLDAGRDADAHADHDVGTTDATGVDARDVAEAGRDLDAHDAPAEDSGFDAPPNEGAEDMPDTGPDLDATADATDAADISMPATNQVTNGSFETGGAGWRGPWYFNVRSPASGAITEDATERTAGSFSARATVTQAAPDDWWWVQLVQPRLHLERGQTYVVSFSMKVSEPRRVNAMIQQQSAPYGVYWSTDLWLSTSWQRFVFTVLAMNTDDVQIAFNLAESAGTVWIDDVSVSP